MANSYMGLLQTDRSRFERDGWPTPTWAFYSCLPLLKDRQTGLGESGMSGHFLHEAFYSFIFLLKERHTGLGWRGMAGQLLHGPSTPFLHILKERQIGL